MARPTGTLIAAVVAVGAACGASAPAIPAAMPAERARAAPASARTAPAPVAPPVSPAPVAPAAEVALEPPPPGILPSECERYLAALTRLGECSPMTAEARADLRRASVETAVAWAAIPLEGRAALAAACVSSFEGIAKATAAACE